MRNYSTQGRPAAAAAAAAATASDTGEGARAGGEQSHPSLQSMPSMPSTSIDPAQSGMYYAQHQHPHLHPHLHQLQLQNPHPHPHQPQHQHHIQHSQHHFHQHPYPPQRHHYANPSGHFGGGGAGGGANSGGSSGFYTSAGRQIDMPNRLGMPFRAIGEGDSAHESSKTSFHATPPPSAPLISTEYEGLPVVKQEDEEADRSHSHPPSHPLHHRQQQQQQQSDEQQKIKRAKTLQKITRNRRITSCLQCRDRKQKCDRQRPMCSNCMAGNSRGGMCTYVDTPEGVQEVLAGETERDAKRGVKRSPTIETLPDVSGTGVAAAANAANAAATAASAAAIAPSVRSSAAPSRPMLLPAQSPLTVRRLNLITATARAGRDRSLDFEARVRYARAAAMGTILFGTPQAGVIGGVDGISAPPPPPPPPAQLYQPLAAVDSLKLPTASEIGPYLDTYRRNVEWMCNVVIVDLNRARFESFLNWWHSNPQTLPADPPLIPLVLTILALALQAKRLAPYCTLRNATARKSRVHDVLDETPPSPSTKTTNGYRQHSPAQSFGASISSEKELLETAQRCIDVLQIACPSNWASAFSAPLDLVRASLLRGIWHMTELHLQFAGSCFATTVRLAHAAALHHDARHWPKMGKEESQARRNIFWNVATMEMMFSMRVVQPSVILGSSLDTRFPDDYEALLNLYRYGGLIEPHIIQGRRSHLRVQPVSKPNFDFHLARFQLTSILIKGQELLKSGDKSIVAERHEEWKRGLTEDIRPYLDSTDEPDETHYLQACALQMMTLSTSIQIHRPRVDENGQWQAPDGQAQRSLEVCIESAQKLIWLIYGIVTRDPGPPYVFYHQCIFHCFQAAIILAILVTFDRSSTFAVNARPSLQTALQTLDLIAEQDGLRNIAEQASRYAATLREVDQKQQARLIGRLDKDNVHRSGVGVPALALAEGDGKMLGGQGYPAKELQAKSWPNASGLPELQSLYSTSSGVQHAHLDKGGGGGGAGAGAGGAGAGGGGTLPSILSFNAAQQTSFGIDFSDLQVFGPTDLQQHAMGLFIDRPFEGTSAGAGGRTANDEGMNLLAASVPQWPVQDQANNGEAAEGVGVTMSGDARDVHVPPTQTASAPAIASLGESFAMDWDEWERAVERLLHTER